ncbi:helix-turn-helix domain-containing protein [Corynebacterium sp.]|uniref:helix-turn-helix domain-containing protein n=1 Tax=Corynebacterium sp. TaxID=1720 RepID=UPI0026E042DB|nr:helix-turn-helix domain-containing protein [Corynebacterium sp.]MDO5511688.1 helix-turn-helix domain-containing protein [Corynebacterium sp.]
MYNATVVEPGDMGALLDLSRFLEQHSSPAALVGPDGDQFELPAEVYRTLRVVVASLLRKQAVSIVPVDQKLTTQQAADVLGISRPTLIKAIDQGELPCERVPGSRHRRILLSDLLAYREQLDNERDALLTTAVQEAEDKNLYRDPPAAEIYQAAIKQIRRSKK